MHPNDRPTDDLAANDHDPHAPKDDNGNAPHPGPKPAGIDVGPPEARVDDEVGSDDPKRTKRHE